MSENTPDDWHAYAYTCIRCRERCHASEVHECPADGHERPMSWEAYMRLKNLEEVGE